MSTPSAPGTPRPPQVTFAGWLTISASVLAVVMAFSEVSRLGSMDTQDAIARFLDQEPGRSLGLSLGDVQDLLRITSTLAAAFAAATAVLGWFVLQRSRGSRLALSVLALPLLLAGLFSGGFATAVVAACATMLWLQPARDWFAGRAPAPVARTPRPSSPPLPTRTVPVDAPPPTTAPYGLPAPLRGRPADPTTERPAPVLWACVLTWTFSAAVAGLLGLTAIALVAAPDQLLEQARAQNPEIARQNMSDSFIVTSACVAAGVLIVWSIAAAVAAVLAFRKVRWAMIALLVSSCAAGALCLLLAVGSLVTIVVGLPCAITVALILRPDVRQWYAAPR